MKCQTQQTVCTKQTLNLTVANHQKCVKESKVKIFLSESRMYIQKDFLLTDKKNRLAGKE